MIDMHDQALAVFAAKDTEANLPRDAVRYVNRVTGGDPLIIEALGLEDVDPGVLE